VNVHKAAQEIAWLEADDGRHALRGTGSLGRSSDNTIVLQSSKVSRHHALLHLQNVGEFWLIDLGSANGTYLNTHRLHRPMRLCDRDQIDIGGTKLTFHQPLNVSAKYRATVTRRTVQKVETVSCWLLVADIVNFTSLCRSVVTGRLAQLLGSWLAACKEIVDKHFGTTNKYLGDGFLAYWRDTDEVSKNILDVIAALKELQKQREPRFRFVLHLGSVAIGGMASMGEESLMGREVNFVFRLEKLAGSLGEGCGLSDTVVKRLQGRVAPRSLGLFEIKGFAGKRDFFAI